MSPTLFLEAFGQLAPHQAVIEAEEEDLYSVFRARAELMGWGSRETASSLLPLYWWIEEAELTAGRDPARIGWVQVGLEDRKREAPDRIQPGQGWAPYPDPPSRGHAIEPELALVAVIQCFCDALRRFGSIRLSGLQVTAVGVDPHPRSDPSCSVEDSASMLVSGLNWFNTTLQARAEALIALDHALLGHRTVAELVLRLQETNTGLFAFGPVVTVPHLHLSRMPAEMEWRFSSLVPSSLGVAVTLPEWTASAVAWVLALVLDTARARAPAVRHCTVRMTQVQVQ